MCHANWTTCKNSERQDFNRSRRRRYFFRCPAADNQGIERGILAREYKAIIQYVVFSSALKGAEYNDIADQLKQHASQELAHALEVARQIDYLGGNPTVTPKQAEFSNESKRMLEIDLKDEQNTIKNYRERIREAEAAGEFALSEALRKVIAQEQDHEIDLKDALGLR